MDKGLSTFNLKWRFTSGIVYQLPVGGNTKGIVKQLIYGWEANAIITDQTGLPFQVTTSQDFSNTGTFWIPRPNRICDGNLPRSQQHPTHWFNTSCFVDPAENTYGNGGVAYLETYGFNSLDFSISKEFPIKERARLEFRAEAFNSLNGVNFDQPASTTDTSTFGHRHVCRSASSDPICSEALVLRGRTGRGNWRCLFLSFSV